MRDFKRSQNSLETKQIRKILNEETRLGISPNSDSESEEVDLQKELYPLGHYINNREEMIDQMFSIIKGTKLRKMLPPILKDMPIDELKADCLIHLLGMSKKRILAILEGREINSSSDSETHSDSSTSPNKKSKVELKPFMIKQEGCSDISDNSEEVVLVDPDLDFLNVASNDSKEVNKTEGKKKLKRKLKKKDLDKKHKRTKAKTSEEASEVDEVQEIDNSAESASDNEAVKESPVQGKTLLEILELEMRARAIRALLKNNDPPEGDESKKPVETKDQSGSKEKSSKVTPAKNFRKKKRKSDDVIVITPKVVTIDLTDENEQMSVKANKKENALSSSQNSSSDNKCQKESVLDKSEHDQGSMDIVTGEELLTRHKTTIEMPQSCSIENSSKNESQNKTSHQEIDKSNWAQRWLESKEVKKVVSTSKICGNIRKKIKSAKLAKKQTPVQDKPDKPPSPSPKVIEGSVVEYELLSKSKSIHNTGKADEVENENQTSISLLNQESGLSGLSETSTAEQVQDVSSTKVENVTTSFVQDDLSGDYAKKDTLSPNIDEETRINNIKSSPLEGTGTPYSKLNYDNISFITNEGTNVLGTVEEEKEITCSKYLNISDNTIEKENDYERNQSDHIELKGDDKDLLKNNKLNDGHDEQPQEKLINSCEEVGTGTEIINEKSRDSIECCSSFSNDGIGKSDFKPESEIFQMDKPVTISLENSKSSEDECDRNKTDIVSKKETQALQVFESDENVAGICKVKTSQDFIEPEALEINITDEDRDIENAIEEINENKAINSKDSMIVID